MHGPGFPSNPALCSRSTPAADVGNSRPRPEDGRRFDGLDTGVLSVALDRVAIAGDEAPSPYWNEPSAERQSIGGCRTGPRRLASLSGATSWLATQVVVDTIHDTLNKALEERFMAALETALSRAGLDRNAAFAHDQPEEKIETERKAISRSPREIRHGGPSS